MDKIKEMKELVNELNQASAIYYKSGQEIMPNKKYDALYDELQALEKETQIVLSNSPTVAVGAEPVNYLPKVEHEFPARSLEKTKDMGKYTGAFKSGSVFASTPTAVLMWKLDGSTLQITYENGVIREAATRGNGVVGSDVTHNIPFITGIPLQIPYKGKLVVRGEAVMSYKEFERLNENLSEEDSFMNPRNTANATVSAYDPMKAKERRVDFIAFSLVYMDADMPGLMNERLGLLESYGFDVVPHNVVWVNDLSQEMENWKPEDYEYPVDGLVTVLNDTAYTSTLAGTSKHPHVLGGYAFKWSDETAETRLMGIEWSASRTGRINPVAVFEPVSLEGTTVTRASVHNLTILNALKLGYNDVISVYKANKIIPQIHENITCGGNLFKIPDVCPVCGCETVRRSNEDGTTEFLYCMNHECPAKHVGKFERLVERDALNVIGVSTSAINTFVQKGWLKELSDIFKLPEHKEQIISMDGFGEKSYENLEKALENSRKTTFKQFFYALGINGAGHDVAKILEKECPPGESKCVFTFNTILEWGAKNKLTAMDGIGPVTADTLISHFCTHYQEIMHLRNELDIIDDVKISVAEKKLPLAGMTFVITGDLNTYPNRNSLKAEIESNGGKVSGSVSKKTTYLINNDINSSSGKNKKAKELNIPIITEQDYKHLL